MRLLLYYIILIIISCNVSASTSINGILKPYSWENTGVLDTQIKLVHKENKLKVFITAIPAQIRPNTTSWNAFPEYAASIKNETYGRITIGAHNADVLMVDAGTLAVNNNDFICDGNHLYSQSLVNTLYPQGYELKVSYLYTYENLYISYAYANNLKELRIMYSNSLSPATDFKTSIGFINQNVIAGFNLQYLGLILGGSYGGNFYTAGIGYNIGPFKSSLTYLNEMNNTILTMSYNVNKNINPFLQVGYSSTIPHNISIGVKLLI